MHKLVKNIFIWFDQFIALISHTFARNASVFYFKTLLSFIFLIKWTTECVYTSLLSKHISHLLSLPTDVTAQKGLF